MRVYVLESLASGDAAHQVVDVYQSSEAARGEHLGSDWTRDDTDVWTSSELEMKITNHETKG